MFISPARPQQDTPFSEVVSEAGEGVAVVKEWVGHFLACCDWATAARTLGLLAYLVLAAETGLAGADW
jgi:hypothetical protein